MHKKITVSAFCIATALSVVLNGLHAKEIVHLPAVWVYAAKSDEHASKISSELHNHVDKQTVKSLLKLPTDNPQVDARSLRLREHKKHQFVYTKKSRLLGALYTHLAFYVVS